MPTGMNHKIQQDTPNPVSTTGKLSILLMSIICVSPSFDPCLESDWVSLVRLAVEDSVCFLVSSKMHVIPVFVCRSRLLEGLLTTTSMTGCALTPSTRDLCQLCSEDVQIVLGFLSSSSLSWQTSEQLYSVYLHTLSIKARA